MNRTKLLAIGNAIAFVITVYVNGLANAIPINGKTTGELSDLYPNLFVPIGFTFSIWGVIYLLLLVFIIYQLIAAFGKTTNSSFISRIGPWFIISAIANCSWILAWHYMLTGLSMIIMIVLLISLIKMYLNLRDNESTISKSERYAVLVCFSVYLGWITVATIANATAVLVGLGWNGGGIDPSTWAMVMIIIASLIGVYFAWLKHDPFYALVIIWALYGIYFKRSLDIEPSKHIILAAQSGMILIGVAAIFQIVRQRLFRSS